MEEIETALRYTLPKRVWRRLKKESIVEIKYSLQLHTTQEGVGEAKNRSSGIHYPSGYRRD